MTWTHVCIASLLAFGCSSHPRPEPPSPPACSYADESEKLRAIIERYTQAAKRLDPYWATYYNVEEDLDKFGDYPSPDYFRRSKALYEEAIVRLREIRVKALSPKDRRTYLLFKEDMQVSLEGLRFPDELFEFNQMDNRLLSWIQDTSQRLTYFPFDSVRRYEAFIRRAQGFPAYVDRQIALLRRGIREGITLSRVAAEKTLNTFKDGLESEVEKNPFWRPVLFMPKTFSPEDRARLTAGFRKMIRERIVPGFRKFDSFFRQVYLPRCRDEYGIGGLPRGKEWYAQKIRAQTNLVLDPKEIHEKGRKEVKRIAAEMDGIRMKLGFRGSQEEFLKRLTGDPKSYFKTPEALFRAFEDAKARISPLIPRYFNLIPKTDYRIVKSENPEDTGASYWEPSETSPQGRLILNTKNLRSVPTYEVTTLFLHEGVPGHHFQLALIYELKDALSEYQRKVYRSTAFVEGWALYAEHLGREMGVFEDPWQRLGNLVDEMLRAVRLVVDTGIHAMGWSRERAIRFMTDRLAMDREAIEAEADRYSVWPGQALAYKIGQWKILELRELAKRELGSRYDVREFHRAVIGNGTVSLGVLERQVRAWIEETNKKR